MSDLETVIGLEVHVELNTESKLFCSCKNVFGGEPNTNICPVCLGLPGTLPRVNKQACYHAVKMGHALNCRINRVSRQDRKNYFYPDLPKAYQISQADIPLCEDGYLDILTDSGIKRIGIERIHIEEDAGKLLHDEADITLCDYNRCGVPLIEIVTRPDMNSSAEARIFLDNIKSILQYIGISDCKMQEGSIRCDVNVSMHEKGSPPGTRCELKNINSFSAALRGIEHEIKRQTGILAGGGAVERETRRFDDKKGVSILMRSKENAQDYRFFPEPDLGALVLDESVIDKLKSDIPELPNQKLIRYVNEHGLNYSEAFIIASSPEKAELYDECVSINRCGFHSAANRIVGEITGFMNDTGKSITETGITAKELCELCCAHENGIVSSSGAKTVLEELIYRGGKVDEIIQRMGLAQNSDTDFLNALAEDVIASNPKSAADYKNGKKNAVGFLVGQAMKASKGKADPSKLKEILEKKLKTEE